MNINITECTKLAIKDLIEKFESKRADLILDELLHSGFIDEEYKQYIFNFEPEDDPDYISYDQNGEALVIDAIEDEIKNQLLKKYNE